MRSTTFYPLKPYGCLITRDVMAIRRPGTYEISPCLGRTTVLTAAMPNGRPAPLTPEWLDTVRLRVKAVLNAAAMSGHTNLVLGAWGCGAFGNPPTHVARIFKEELESYQGVFAAVVFAIIDPVNDGNLRPFKEKIEVLEVLAHLEKILIINIF